MVGHVHLVYWGFFVAEKQLCDVSGNEVDDDSGEIEPEIVKLQPLS